MATHWEVDQACTGLKKVRYLIRDCMFCRSATQSMPKAILIEPGVTGEVQFVNKLFDLAA